MIHALEKSLQRRAYEEIKFKNSHNYFYNPVTTTFYMKGVEREGKGRQQGATEEVNS